MVLVSESDKCRTVKLVSGGGQRGKPGSTYRTFRYDLVERAFLRFIRELKSSDVMPAADEAGADVRTLTNKLANINLRVEKLQEELKTGGDFKSGLALLRDLEKDRATVGAELERAKVERASPAAKTLSETRSMLDLLAKTGGEELAALRGRVKARIRQLVDSMWLLVEEKADGLQQAELQVNLCSGYVTHVRMFFFTRGALRNGMLLEHGIRRDKDVPYRDLSGYRDSAETRSWYDAKREERQAQLAGYPLGDAVPKELRERLHGVGISLPELQEEEDSPTR
jgi:hypothetical protein